MGLYSFLTKTFSRNGQNDQGANAPEEKSDPRKDAEDYEATLIVNHQKDCYSRSDIERAVNIVGQYFDYFLTPGFKIKKLHNVPSLLLAALRCVGIIRHHQIEAIIGININGLYSGIAPDQDDKERDILPAELPKDYIIRVNEAKQKLLNYINKLPQETISEFTS